MGPTRPTSPRYDLCTRSNDVVTILHLGEYPVPLAPPAPSDLTATPPRHGGADHQGRPPPQNGATLPLRAQMASAGGGVNANLDHEGLLLVGKVFRTRSRAVGPTGSRHGRGTHGGPIGRDDVFLLEVFRVRRPAHMGMGTHRLGANTLTRRRPGPGVFRALVAGVSIVSSRPNAVPGRDSR